VQVDHLAIAREEMVVVALDPHAAADVERARLTSDVGPAFVELDPIPALQELARRDQAGDSGTDDRDASGRHFGH